MKKIIFVMLALVLTTEMLSQSFEEPKLKFQGGVWSGTNGKTSIIGVPAAKFSVTFKTDDKAKLEIGIMLIPGLIIDSTGARLGLSAGATVTLRKEKRKLNPVVGLVFVKTGTWQAMPGIGFIF